MPTSIHTYALPIIISTKHRIHAAKYLLMVTRRSSSLSRSFRNPHVHGRLTMHGPVRSEATPFRGELNTGRSIRWQFHRIGVFPRFTLKSPEGTSHTRCPLSYVCQQPAAALNPSGAGYWNRQKRTIDNKSKVWQEGRPPLLERGSRPTVILICVYVLNESIN